MFKKLSEKPVAEVQNEQVEKWKEEDLLHKCVTAREGGENLFSLKDLRPQTESRAFIMLWQEP